MLEIAGGIILAVLFIALLPRVFVGTFVVFAFGLAVLVWLGVTWLIAELFDYSFTSVGFWTGAFGLALAFEVLGERKK